MGAQRKRRRSKNRWSRFFRALQFSEELGAHHRWSFRTTATLFSGKSDFQDIMLLSTPTFGTVLVLDGRTQSAEADEQARGPMQ